MSMKFLLTFVRYVGKLPFTMKKILFFLLISLHAFSQVFEVDSSFKFEGTKRQSPANSILYQLPNGLMVMNTSNAILFNGKLIGAGSYLLNKEGVILSKYLNIGANLNVVTSENKFIERFFDGSSMSSLRRFQVDGTVDTTFKFPSLPATINFVNLLPNDNLIVTLFNNFSKNPHLIFDKKGNFISFLDLSQFGVVDKKFLVKLIFNESNELYMIFKHLAGNVEIIKTNEKFELLNSFDEINNSKDKSLFSEIYVFKNEIYSLKFEASGTKRGLDKFDRNGNLVWSVPSDKLANTGSFSNNIIFQNDGSLDLIQFNKKYLKILPNGQIIEKINENNGFNAAEYSFEDGSKWLLQKNGSVIKKVNLEDKIDTSFKINIQYEEPFSIYKILKMNNGNYLVDYGYFDYKDNYLAARVYNKKNEMIHEIYNSSSFWQATSIGNAFVLNGNGKFYYIDSSLKITTKIDTVIKAFKVDTSKFTFGVYYDFKNDFAYKIEANKLSNLSTITRFEIRKGKFDSFKISNEKAYKISTLSDGRLAVYGLLNEPLFNQYIDIYKPNGERDLGVARIKFLIINNYNEHFQDSYFIDYSKGFIVSNAVWNNLEGLKRFFYRFNEDGTKDENYIQNTVFNGGTVKFKEDGSMYLSSANLIKPKNDNKFYNLMKVFPNGEIDDTFKSEVGGFGSFEFMGKDTILVAKYDKLERLILKTPKNIPYFYFEALPSKVTWDYILPIKLDYKTNFKNLKIVVSGDGFLNKNEIVINVKRAGLIKIQVFDEFDNIIKSQNIVLQKIKPYFINSPNENLDKYGKFNFSVISSSGLPVIINVLGSNFENSFSIEPPLSPTFEVKMVSNGNDQFEKIEQTFLALPLKEEDKFSGLSGLIYYPNPVKDKLIIEANNLEILDLKIFNTEGREIPITIVATPNRFELSLTKVPTGLYFLQVSRSGIRDSYRIMVE